MSGENVKRKIGRRLTKRVEATREVNIDVLSEILVDHEKRLRNLERAVFGNNNKNKKSRKPITVR